MPEKRRHADFSRWVVSSVLLPSVAVFILRFSVIPRYYDEDVAGQFGGIAWIVLGSYLLCLCLIAALWKWRLEKNERRRKAVVQSDASDVV